MEQYSICAHITNESLVPQISVFILLHDSKMKTQSYCTIYIYQSPVTRSLWWNDQNGWSL